MFNIGDDIIDSRDLIARLEELQSERECMQDDVDDAESVVTDVGLNDDDDDEGAAEAAESNLDAAEAALVEWDTENADELRQLDEANTEGEGYIADWIYGEALILDEHFTAYAEQLAEDIGAVDRDQPWPLNHIDWEAAADALREDYTEIEIGGYTYLAR